MLICKYISKELIIGSRPCLFTLWFERWLVLHSIAYNQISGQPKTDMYHILITLMWTRAGLRKSTSIFLCWKFACVAQIISGHSSSHIYNYKVNMYSWGLRDFLWIMMCRFKLCSELWWSSAHIQWSDSIWSRHRASWSCNILCHLHSQMGS